MGKGKRGWLLALAWLAAGCCSHPGVFGKMEAGLRTVQAVYDPLLGKYLEEPTNDKVSLALVSADSALTIFDQLQRQWCPDPKVAAQLENQVQVAQKLAQEAGVAPAGSPAK
jgi:hypothetical protein